MSEWIALFISFFKIGAFSFGGGYAMIPMIRHEVLQTHGWMTEMEFVDIIAISQMTPGPIAINLATFLGYEVGGIIGSFIASFAVVLPSFLIMSILFFAFQKLLGNRYMEWFFTGLRPIIVGLIAAGFLTVFHSGIVDAKSILIAIFSLLLLERWKLHPVLVIVLAGGLGALLYGL